MSAKLTDITGLRFGKLVVLQPTRKRLKNAIVWLCQCDCGKLKELPLSELRGAKSCGCLVGAAICDPAEITDRRVGMLTVWRKSSRKTSQGGSRWWCVCDCGEIKEVTYKRFIRGKVRDCGCQSKPKPNRKTIWNDLDDRSNIRYLESQLEEFHDESGIRND